MTPFPGTDTIIELTYLIATALFVMSLKWMSSPTTARHGVWAGELGMLLAIVGTLLNRSIVDYKWVAIALVLGTIIGVPLGKVQMTAVPQRTALSHAFGACCVTLVGTAEFYLRAPAVPKFMMSVLSMEVILGSLTFTGSLMAAGKLQEILPQRPIIFKGQNIVNLGMLLVAIGVAVFLVFHPDHTYLFPVLLAIPLLFGVMMIIPIGGADMPTVISLLNAYAGLSASAMGFVLDSKLLIVAGALGRRLRLDSLRQHVQGHEPLVLERAVWRVRTGTNCREGRQGNAAGSQRFARRGGRNSRRGQQSRHRARLRHGRGAGAAQSPRTLRQSDQARHRREVRHSPRRGPHARPHERAARRSGHSLRQAARHGRNQRRISADRRGPDHRRERRHEPRRAHRFRRAPSSACPFSTWTRRTR